MESKTDVNKNHSSGNQISLIEKNEDVIQARITLECPYCSYRRVFKNQFSPSKMELITVTFKIIDWLTCDKCDHQLNFALDFYI
jgi:DNA-directed RNA polymerase subunit RPC12/RpoP